MILLDTNDPKPLSFKRRYPARYMLLVLPWNGDAGNLIPAVNHLGTGRLQTMRREWNPRYYRLVEKFSEATGVPVLMNTSFNLRGEPIVGSPANAWNTFSKNGIDVLVLGHYLVEKYGTINEIPNYRCLALTPLTPKKLSN